MQDFTKEEKEFAEKMRQESLDRIFNCDFTPITPEIAKEMFTKLFDIAEKLDEMPKDIHIVDSPHECQELANKLSGTDRNYYSPLTYSVLIDSRYMTEFEIGLQLGKIKPSDDPQVYENYLKFKWCLDHSMFFTVILDDAIITSQPPVSMSIDDNYELHNANGPSMLFPNGDATYHWHGLSLPKKYIEDKDNLTKDDIMGERNAERRRAIFELVGPDRYAELLDLRVIDSITIKSKTSTCSSEELGVGGALQEFKKMIIEDKNPIVETTKDVVLLKTRTVDEIAEDYLYFVKVICHSTGRIYHLPVPEFSNAKDAVAWTFNMSGEEYSPEIET